MIKKILFICLALYVLDSRAQAVLTIHDHSKPDSVRVVPLHGVISLVPGEEIVGNEKGNEITYSIPLAHRLQYIHLYRNGKLIYLPIVEGEQTYHFSSDSDNDYTTDNSYQSTFQELNTLTNQFTLPYRDSLYNFEKEILSVLPGFIDSIRNIIRFHPYRQELEYTFIRSFEYALQKKVLNKRKGKKLNKKALREMDRGETLFGCWGYNNYLKTLLEDYYEHRVNMFNHPFRAYKPKSLKRFVLNDGLFENKALNDFLSYYKIKRLENLNDKNALFQLADSLNQTVHNQILKKEIEAYLLGSQKRVRPKIKAPDFFLKEVADTTMHRLSDLSGKVVVLDFWATWCAPCIKGLPRFANLHDRFRDSVCFISISQDGNEKKVIDFLKKNPQYVWTFLFDGQNGPTGIAYETNAIPRYFIIDEKGTLQLETSSLSEIEDWLKHRFN